jgi:SepF-like predicted cell division protein (DUF552 family)
MKQPDKLELDTVKVVDPSAVIFDVDRLVKQTEGNNSIVDDLRKTARTRTELTGDELVAQQHALDCWLNAQAASPKETEFNLLRHEIVEKLKDYYRDHKVHAAKICLTKREIKILNSATKDDVSPEIVEQIANEGVQTAFPRILGCEAVYNADKFEVI